MCALALSVCSHGLARRVSLKMDHGGHLLLINLSLRHAGEFFLLVPLKTHNSLGRVRACLLHSALQGRFKWTSFLVTLKDFFPVIFGDSFGRADEVVGPVLQGLDDGFSEGAAQDGLELVLVDLEVLVCFALVQNGKGVGFSLVEGIIDLEIRKLLFEPMSWTTYSMQDYIEVRVVSELLLLAQTN
jgi:hypothetical protein